MDLINLKNTISYNNFEEIGAFFEVHEYILIQKKFVILVMNQFSK